MSIPKKVENYLKKTGYKYEIIEHKETYTAWDTSQTKKINPREIVKTLVIKADKDYVLALIPADKNLDKKKLLTVINTKKKKLKEKSIKGLDFAKEAWMKKNIPGKLGAVPPFSGLLKIAVYADSLILKNKKLYLGSGDYRSSVLLTVAEYIKREEVEKGNFSMIKKIKKQKTAPKKKAVVKKSKKKGCCCCK